MRAEPRALVRCLTPSATRTLEGAAGKAVSAQHGEVDVEHMLLCMLEPDDGEAALLLQAVGANRPKLRTAVETALSRVRASAGKRPAIAENVFNWIEDSWLTASLELGEVKLRTGALLYQLVLKPGRYTSEEFEELEKLNAAEVKQALQQVLGKSTEAIEAAPSWGEGGAAGAAPPPSPQLGAASIASVLLPSACCSACLTSAASSFSSSSNSSLV